MLLWADEWQRRVDVGQKRLRKASDRSQEDPVHTWNWVHRELEVWWEKGGILQVSCNKAKNYLERQGRKG